MNYLQGPSYVYPAGNTYDGRYPHTAQSYYTQVVDDDDIGQYVRTM